MDYFTRVLLVDLWSCKDACQASEIAIKNSKFNYNLTNGIYRYKKHNSYSYDVVLAIHFYTIELKNYEGSEQTNSFQDIVDENERDFDF